jgi:quinol monooxygenase YgiN
VALHRSEPQALTNEPSVVELRRYTLHPGTRETLVTLFERELVETQEAAGMSLLGWFRDLDDPDAFVWLRGFADMPSRADALTAFYRGPVWAAHRDAANATMVDSDDVLLLRPAHGGPGLRRDDVAPDGRLLVTTYHLREPAGHGFLEAFTTTVEPALTAAGGRSVGVYVTEPTPNNWPALPVREGEEVLVALRAFADAAEHRAFSAAVAGEELAAWVDREPVVTLLAPTTGARTQAG